MRELKILQPSIVPVMRLINSGTITIKDAAEIMQCSNKTIQNRMKDYGIETVKLGTTQTRRDKAIANAERNELLATLAKRVKNDKEDIQTLAKEYNVAVRTLYRWVLKV
jgi:transposase